jgi:hypothetical protein
MRYIYIPAMKPEDWSRFLAEPKHWKKGYSAMSFAMCWQEADGFPDSVTAVFNQSDFKQLHDIKLLLAIPEHKVPLPGGSAASQNDLFILAKGGGQMISITVEGKVSEPFGNKSVCDWYKKSSPGKMKRLKFLCCELDVRPDDAMDVKYQLLHRAVSAILEAQKFNAPNAMMLVHSFSQTNEWFEDYAAFAALFGVKAKVNRVYSAGIIGGINLFLCWVKGDEKYLSMEPASRIIRGTVAARKCECCGHHEIGITAVAGDFIPLKTGMKVEVQV